MLVVFVSRRFLNSVGEGLMIDGLMEFKGTFY